ncbi:MAG: carbohydrate ABC transporter permease [Actinobacteria bacterium]|nr:carbohydrate ABC transporter permease [Actinomycetota bacterium]
MTGSRKISQWLTNALLIFAVFMVGGPFLWVLLGSFKTEQAINNPLQLLFVPTLENWSIVIEGGSFTRFGILSAQVLPPAVLVFPFLAMAYALRLNDTLVAVTVAHISLVLPVVTWFLIGFFEAVPKEIEEQAQVDGLGRFAAFRAVVLPQVAPGLGAAAVFGFVLSWNDLFYALILAPGNAKTLPVAIAGFNTFRGVQLGAMCAAILVSVVPVLIASFFVQRRLVRGISGGSLKY